VSDSKIRTTPKGFIVEADGIHGACDISEFGGWRNFIASRPAN
jgi:allophanate hydrolase